MTRGSPYSSGRGATRIVPAEIKNERYVRPFSEIEPGEYWVGRREVWTASHGRACRYHVMVDHGVAACRPHIRRWSNLSVILLCDLIPIGDMPSHMACLRNGCKQLFEAFLGHKL